MAEWRRVASTRESCVDIDFAGTRYSASDVTADEKEREIDQIARKTAGKGIQRSCMGPRQFHSGKIGSHLNPNGSQMRKLRANLSPSEVKLQKATMRQRAPSRQFREREDSA